jgi:hypothetical protein
MNTPLRLDPDAVCDGCGCHGAFRFDGEALCADCYAGRGSCCSAEFSGRDDPVDDDASPPSTPASSG